MRVGIDGGCWSNRRGYGRFLRELLAALVRIDSGVEYTVFLDPPSFDSFPLRDAALRAVRVKTSESVAQAASAASHRSVTDLLRMSLAVARKRLDVFFFPSVYSYFPLLRPVPLLLGVHDTMADRHPEFAFSSRRAERLWNWKVRLALAQADLILTVSEHSKRSIEKQFQWRAEKIRVIYEAASPHFHPVPPTEQPHPYILYVGGISPNKNLSTLVRAFARLHPHFPGWRLVLAGDYQGDRFKTCHQELKAEITAAGLDGDVVFPGYVPEEQLGSLLGGAALFAFPSLDEGFGLPVLEAMACGIPVVAGRGHALDEVVGDAGILVDPHREEELAGAMEKILADKTVAAAFREKSLRRAAEFSWDRAARQLLAIFHEMTEART